MFFPSIWRRCGLSRLDFEFILDVFFTHPGSEVRYSLNKGLRLHVHTKGFHPGRVTFVSFDVLRLHDCFVLVGLAALSFRGGLHICRFEIHRVAGFYVMLRGLSTIRGERGATIHACAVYSSCKGSFQEFVFFEETIRVCVSSILRC